MKKWSMIVAAAVLLCTGSGCSFLTPASEMLSVQVEPEDAVVIINGTRFEGVPFFTPVYKGTDVLVSVYKPKAPIRNYVIRRHLSTTGILDCVGAIFIFPAFGLLCGGAWELEQNNIIIDLDENKTNIEEIKGPADIKL